MQYKKEVDFLVREYGVNMLAVLDELISADTKRLSEFCDRISKYGLRWMAQIRADSVDKPTLQLMKDAGCHQVSIGVESGSNKILESMGKRTTIERIEQTLGWAYELGIGIQGNFIFGDKAETRETTIETLNWWLNHRHFMLNLSYIIPYPGCDLYKYATERGIIEDPLDYIRKGCPTVPLSPDAYEMYRLVEEYKDRGILPATVKLVDHIGDDPFRGRLYRVVAHCPHCQQDIEYSNLYDGSTNANMVKDYYRIACRNCNQRFDIKKEDLWPSS